MLINASTNKRLRAKRVLFDSWYAPMENLKLNRQRRLSKDCEHLPQTGDAFIYVAIAALWLESWLMFSGFQTATETYRWRPHN